MCRKLVEEYLNNNLITENIKDLVEGEENRVADYLIKKYEVNMQNNLIVRIASV